MKLLLPHRFKKLGTIITPTGLLFWVLMQLGYVKAFTSYLFGKSVITSSLSVVNFFNAFVAILGFFMFLGGLYCIAFSKEKVEDEMVQRTRLDSFQFAAAIQIISTIVGFLIILFLGETGEEKLMLFLVGLVLLFWLSFISRFNYILHVRYQ